MGALFSNNASSTISGAITAVSTQIAVANGTGILFPTPGAGEWFNATLTKDVGGVPTREIVKVTARASDVLTVVRAQEGTIPTTFSPGDKIDLRITAAGLNGKMGKDGGAFTGPVDMGDQAFSGAVIKDHAIAFKDAAAVNALDYRDGSHQRWAPATGAQTLTITNWPPAGYHGELLIEGVNLGAATITGPLVNWIKPDGTFATSTAWNTNQGAVLRTAGIDFVLLWTRDGGTTIFGKVIR